jgi:acyl-[acyl-carrier-protein]-phospholipid O-acyltransferase/long-chain-fatty-acid--[acyl-carrier-protein] ligase
MRASTTTMDKLRAALGAGSPLTQRRPDDPAVVLFTSGSEGAPKGVALSHANLLANIAQIGTRFDLRLTDICFNPLPMFHAFGLTGGLLLGLVSSMKVYLYPTPLHYREIPKTIDKAQATFLLGADTFLAHYVRNADETAFASLRYIIAGAEAVKAETRRLYMEKFGLDILEGYGVTEASPVIAVKPPRSAKSEPWAGSCRSSSPASSRRPASRTAPDSSYVARTSCSGIIAPKIQVRSKRLQAACTTPAISSRSTRKASS